MVRNLRRISKRTIEISPLFAQLTVIENCTICKKFDHRKECPLGDPSVNVRKYPDDHIPQVDLYLDKEKQKCRIVIDKDSRVSVLKMKVVPPHISIVSADTVQLKTVMGTEIPHLGEIYLDVFDCPMVFYVVSDDIGIRSDGVVGMDFFSTVSAQWLNGFMLVKGEKFPIFQFVNDSISIPPRSCITDYVNVLNSDLVEGYVPKLVFGKGIFAGDCMVSVEDNKAYLLIFNYTKYKIGIPRPCVELESARSITKFPYYVKKDSTIELIANLLCGESNCEGISEFMSNGRVKEAMELLRLDHLDKEELEAVKRWIENYNDLFHLSRDKLNVSYCVMHKVNSQDNEPVKCKQFNLSEEEKVEMKKVTDELLYQGIIRVSNSPYDSPAYVVSDTPDTRGNKKWKLIVDYSKLNEKTNSDAYPAPHVLDILDDLVEARYFSVLHFAWGYYQIQMNPDDIPKTAFSTPDGHFEFKRMSAGLRNARATFQRYLDDVLLDLEGEGLYCYLGSIIVFSKNLESHEEILTKLSAKLMEVNLKLQPEQCEFFRKEVIYRGYKISKDGIRPDAEKLKTIENFWDWPISIVDS